MNALSACVFICWIIGCVPCFAITSLRTVVLTDGLLPGFENGDIINSLQDSDLNNLGQVTFRAFVTKSDIYREGIWAEDFDANLRLIELAHEQAPGLPVGASFATFYGGGGTGPKINDSGTVSFLSTLFTGLGGVTTSNRKTLWINDGQSSRLIVRGEDVMPDLPGDGFLVPPSPFSGTLNEVGELAFASFQGFWIADTAQDIIELRTIATQGTAAPGTTNGELIAFQKRRLNNTGEVAFVGFLDTTLAGISFENNQGIWIGRNAADLKLLVREGDQASGAPSRSFFESFESLVFNDQSQVAFEAELKHCGNVCGGISGANDKGIWATRSDGSQRLVAREKSPAPGTGPEGFFGSLSRGSGPTFGGRILIDDDGEVAFRAYLLQDLQGTGEVTKSNNTGIWTEQAGSGLELLAREGDPAPGMPSGMVFDNLLYDPIGNENGQVAFYALLRPNIVEDSSPIGSGIWAQDRNGDLRLIVSAGDPLEVATGDTRIVDRLALDFDLNNLGQLLFRATFEDGTQGIFVSNIATISEPTIVPFDIKPGSFPNSVNLKSKGVLSVAILSTDEFDVNNVDIDTLLFGDPLLIDNGGTAVSPLRSALEDVSGDELLDLTLKFSTADLVEHGALGFDTVEGLLTGALLDGTPLEGTDSIRIVPPNGSNGNGLQINTVPEPTTFVLALAALCLVMSRRRSH